MKKLKVYKKCDFRLIEVYSGRVADQLIQDSFNGKTRPDEGDQRPGSTDPTPGKEIWGEAAGARSGIWDE